MLIRARLQSVRETGKVVFLTLRQATYTAQAVIWKADAKDLFKWIASVPKESVIDFTARVGAVDKRVESVSCGNFELVIATAFGFHREEVDTS